MYDISGPLFSNCSSIFEVEQCFVPERAALRVKHTWHIVISVVIAYLVSIFGLRHYMSSRKAYQLRWPMVAWNGALAAYSLLAIVRMFPTMRRYVLDHDLLTLVCRGTELGPYQQLSFWIWVQVYSKIVELGDTFFVVLRKKELIFLHWYHHVTVLLFCWLCFQDLNDVGATFGLVNYFVHSIMYTYFCLRALGVKIAPWISRTITLCQIAQMFLGCYITFLIANAKMNGSHCKVTGKVCLAAMLMYASYLYLFVDYFYKSYIASPSKSGPSDIPHPKAHILYKKEE